MRDGTLVDIIGYIIYPDVDLDEYKDYMHKRFRADNIALDLHNGNLPPGLVLRDETGKIAMVCRNRYNLQEMRLP